MCPLLASTTLLYDPDGCIIKVSELSSIDVWAIDLLPTGSEEREV